MDRDPNQTQMMMDQGSEGSFSPATCLGTTVGEKLPCLKTPAVPNLQILSENLIRISNQPNCLSDYCKEPQEEFPCPSGSMSSKERQSTLIKSSRHFIVSQLIQREKRTLETLSLVSGELKRNGRLRQVLSGLPPGDLLRERLLLYLSTENVNWPSMEIILRDCLPPSAPVHITKSISLIKGSETKSEAGKHCCSPIISTSPLSMLLPCRTMESSSSVLKDLEVEENQAQPRTMCATDSTVRRVK